MEEDFARFEQAVLPHLDAAYNLARWLTRNTHDAEDVVQESCLRAFKSFASFRGGDGRPWLIAIVRNTCYTWLRQNRSRELATEFDEVMHSLDSESINPEELLLRGADVQLVTNALEELPVEYREVLVLRELEGLSYKVIAYVTEVPIGTVMSRLARGRKRLQEILSGTRRKEAQL